jgi:L-ascorbate metabolism protein UlaG (beta-lactamase superfamily)
VPLKAPERTKLNKISKFFMTITWFGQSCFKIQSGDVTLVTDPYNPEVGFKLPRLTADIVTVSHDHYDHNNAAGVTGENGAPFLISAPGEYEIKGVFVYGIPFWHDKNEGKDRGQSIAYRIEMEGISVAHLGDLGHTLSDEQVAELDGVDILLIPVGGKWTIGANEAVEIINEIEPRIVIPMHYKIPGLKVDVESADKFLKEMGASKAEKMAKLKISKKDLPQEEMKVILLEKS